MIDKEYVISTSQSIKTQIGKCISKKHYNDALALTSIVSYFLYSTNVNYTDSELEKALAEIADALGEKLGINNQRYESEDVILFYDGFGLNDRGLAQIYLKALSRYKKVVYVSFFDRKGDIPDISDIITSNNGIKVFIDRKKKSYISQITQLNSIIQRYKPAKFFFYSTPDDVVATPLMIIYKDCFERYQINLTDHAFWLGVKCIDRCVEFRNYGAMVSREYRGIDEDKIVIIPMYPIVHREKAFQGYPFLKKDGQKIIFSGGALYKTLDDSNKYYEMVEHILSEHKNVVFWYAGSGDDTKMQKIIRKFPERAFLTQERGDLFQILENSDIYLSTYPLCGGLMFQYAAMAGCVPVTLKNGNISDGFLIEQDKIDVEFSNTESLYNEVNRLLDDDQYALCRGKLMKDSVVSVETFDEEVRKLICDDKGGRFKPVFSHIDTDTFRAWYLEGLTKAGADSMLLRRGELIYGIRFFPVKVVRGLLHILIKKVKR